MAVRIDELPWGPKNLGQTFPSLASLISLFLKNSFTIAGILLLALLIFGGFTFIMNAGGDPKKAEQSKTIITNVLFGFAIVFTAYFIIQIIEVITGLKILNPSI